MSLLGHCFLVYRKSIPRPYHLSTAKAPPISQWGFAYGKQGAKLRPLARLDAGERGEVALTTLLDAALLHSGGHLGTLGEVVLRASRDEVLHGRGTAARVGVEVVTVLGAVLATAHAVRELAPTTGTGVPLVLLRRGEETLRTAGTTLADLAADGEEDAENEDDDDDGDEPVASLSGEGG